MTGVSVIFLVGIRIVRGDTGAGTVGEE
jgi:hypothetical protein